MNAIATDVARAMFEPADRLDVDGWSAAFAEDVELRFGNAEVVRGRDAVRAAVGQFFGSIAGLRHEVLQDWAVGETVIQKLQVTYTRHDGSTLTVPAVNILQVRDGRIARYEIYVDLGPLHD